jgi:hypothetical protein
MQCLCGITLIGLGVTSDLRHLPFVPHRLACDRSAKKMLMVDVASMLAPMILRQAQGRHVRMYQAAGHYSTDSGQRGAGWICGVPARENGLRRTPYIKCEPGIFQIHRVQAPLDTATLQARTFQMDFQMQATVKLRTQRIEYGETMSSCTKYEAPSPCLWRTDHVATTAAKDATLNYSHDPYLILR